MSLLDCHLILRGYTSNNWAVSSRLLESYRYDFVCSPHLWPVQLCAKCGTATKAKTYCPIVFSCVECTSPADSTNDYNWTTGTAWAFTKLLPVDRVLMEKALCSLLDLNMRK